MPLLSGFNVSIPEVNLLGQAALAAFEDVTIPAGWNVVTPQQLGVGPQYWDGNHFANGGASAIVLQQGSSWIVAFRGTDDPSDAFSFPQLASGSYIDQFQPLLSAVASAAPQGTNFHFTGASLGGGAANQMASIAATAYGGVFAAAKFVAFASPNISNASGILNFGFENDPIYRGINGHGDSPSSLDNLVLATSDYMAANFDGLHPYDEYAHSESEMAFDALGRVADSAFQHLMHPDAVVLFDANADLVQDVTPGREGTGVFYLGEARDDHIAGRSGNDFIEGANGNDLLSGGEGNDALAGGTGNDAVYGNQGGDTLFGNQNDDQIFGGQDNDVVFGGQDQDQLYGNLGEDQLYGNLGADFLHGGIGNDMLFGGQSNDTMNGGADDDVLQGGLGSDLFVFAPAQGNDVIADFRFEEGDRLDLQGQDYVLGQNNEGQAALVLEDGGTIVLLGLTSDEFQTGFIA